MQSSLTHHNYLDPRFLARGTSRIAHRLGHQNTDEFRRALLALLDGWEIPLSTDHLGVMARILKSPLGNKALDKLNRRKYYSYITAHRAHEDAVVGDLVKTTEAPIVQEEKRSQLLKILAEWVENTPVSPEHISHQALLNHVVVKQISAFGNQSPETAESLSKALSVTE